MLTKSRLHTCLRRLCRFSTPSLNYLRSRSGVFSLSTHSFRHISESSSDDPPNAASSTSSPSSSAAAPTTTSSTTHPHPSADALPHLLEPTSPEAEDRFWASTVYPAASRGRQSQARRSVRPSVDPSSTSVLLFPGQGAQRVGMAEGLLPYPHVKDMFSEASDILGYDLLALCRRGPAEELNRTDRAQPALLVTSLAAVECLREEDPAAVDSCMAAAGFSVGELAALTFAGSLRFADAVLLARVRGEAMQAACEMTAGGMMTVIMRPDAKVNFACSLARRWCHERLSMPAAECRVASYLFPHCKVIAGNAEALQFVAEHAEELRLRRCSRLRVAGAFHTRLMEPAAEPFLAALQRANIASPTVPVYSNVTATRHRRPDQIRRHLGRQLMAPVRWEQTMHVLYERAAGVPFPRTFECGPGASLMAILKKVNAKAAASGRSVG